MIAMSLKNIMGLLLMLDIYDMCASKQKYNKKVYKQYCQKIDTDFLLDSIEPFANKTESRQAKLFSLFR